MKLLGWMHRKFRHNSSGGDPFRDFIAGHACNCLSGRTSLDESHHHHQTPRLSRHTFRPVQDQWLMQLSDGVDTVHNLEYLPHAQDPDADYVYDDAPAAAELFHGLLAIGTLGSADVDSDVGSVTPTFGGPAPAPAPLQVQSVVDAIAEKEEKEVATEADLMLINTELEKVLFAMEAAEEEEAAGMEPAVDLARFSSVSARQLVVISSPATGAAAAGAACPLQEYLLGSTVGMADTAARPAGPRERKELHRRPSLGELFMKSRALEGGSATDGTGRFWDKDKADKQHSAAKVHLLVKKMLMRRRSGSKSSSGVLPAGYGDADYKGHQPQHAITSSDTKFHKIMQMFHRKVHPENLVAAKKAMKLTAEKAKNKPLQVHGGGTDSFIAGGGAGNNGKSIKRGVALQKDDHSTCLNWSISLDECVGGTSANSSGNREHWIKTDADFLVLEL